MNKQELHEAFSTIHASEDLVKEVMMMEKKHSSFPWRGVLRTAACMALILGLLMAALGLRPGKDGIVTGAGILDVTAYALEESGETAQMRETILEPGKYVWWAGNVNSMIMGMPLTLYAKAEGIAEEDITFRVVTDAGTLKMGENGNNQVYQKHFEYLNGGTEIKNNTVIFWNNYDLSESDTPDQGDRAYIDVVIYGSDCIIGYAVLEINRVCLDETVTTMYQISILANESLTTEGEEALTEEYVQKLIEGVKN